MWKKVGIVLLAIAGMFLAAMLAVFFTGDEKKERVEQHLVAQSGEKDTSLSIRSEDFETHLPLVSIETTEEIPGNPVFGADGTLMRGEDGRLLHSNSANTGLEYTTAQITVYDKETGNNRLSDSPVLQSQVQIKIHGNSSRLFDKKNYRLQLIDETGAENSQPVMGMDSHDEWVLYASALDKTLIRTYMWYNLAGKIMDYAPNCRFCEVFLNGTYIGVYLMEETITNGENCRANLTRPMPGTDRTGYILRLDRGSDVDVKNIRTFSQYTYRTQRKMNIVYPGALLTESMAASIRQEFSDFEKCLYSYDYDEDIYGYWNYIDTDSWVDYYVLNEFMCNYDAGFYSTYVYKDLGGKYKMCVWDVDGAFGNYQEVLYDYDSSYDLAGNIWFSMLFRDEDFTGKVISRYKQLRKTWLKEEYLSSYASEVREYLGSAITRNNKVWGSEFGPKNGLLIPADRNPDTYEEAMEQYVTYMQKRGRFMDETIDTLQQYCHESKVKRYNP